VKGRHEDEEDLHGLALMRLLDALLTSGDVQLQRMDWTCTHYRFDRSTSHHCMLLRKDLSVAKRRTDRAEHERVL
jgi:hypothetical protein